MKVFRPNPRKPSERDCLKNREQLFTFLEHDGVPWNNNAAENAIRRFAYFRDDTAPLTREEGLKDYLVLLSLFQTCRYKAVNFWRFLLSRQKDIDAFAGGASSPGRRDSTCIRPASSRPIGRESGSETSFIQHPKQVACHHNQLGGVLSGYRWSAD